jgi:hypothetical protein
MASTTSNLALYKPTVGGDADAWGTQLNANMDILDNAVTLASTQTLTNKTISGSSNTVTNLSLTTAVTGILPVANGGTGGSSQTANNVLLGNGTGALLKVAPGTSGNVLTSNGTTWTSAAPSGGGGGGTVTSVSGTGSGLGFSLSGTVTTTGSLTLSAPSASALRTSMSIDSNDSVTFGAVTASTGLSTDTYGFYLGSSAYGMNLNGTQVSVGIRDGNGVEFTPSITNFTVNDVRKVGGGSWGTVSDLRLKDVQGSYSLGLAAIKQLNPIAFKFNSHDKNSKLSQDLKNKLFVGLGAQDVEQTALSSMVKTEEDGYKILDNSELIYALVNAVKELSAEIEALKG